MPAEALCAVLAELESAGSEQTRKTYARHGVSGPMFGVSFATLKTLARRLGVKHELALELWDSGNYDAQNLAVKVVDPGRMTVELLEHWAQSAGHRALRDSLAIVAAEGEHGPRLCQGWLTSHPALGWTLVGQLALRCPTAAEDWLAHQVAEIERGLADAPNSVRQAMNQSLIQLGCRSMELRQLVEAAAQRLGPVEVDHGDTACKTPEVLASLEKAWIQARAKGFASPAEQERARESPRRR